MLLLLDAVAWPAVVAIGDDRAFDHERVKTWRAEGPSSPQVAHPLPGLFRTALDSLPARGRELRRIVAATGPGAFTGVRAAVAMARLAALALDAESVGVDSFRALARHLDVDHKIKGRVGIGLGSEARPVWALADLHGDGEGGADLGAVRTDAIDLAAASHWAGANPLIAQNSAALRAAPPHLLALGAAIPAAEARRPSPFYGRGADAKTSPITPPRRIGGP